MKDAIHPWVLWNAFETSRGHEVVLEESELWEQLHCAIMQCCRLFELQLAGEVDQAQLRDAAVQ